MPTTFLSNSAHYTRVLAHCKDVKHTLWIGTADIKDAYIELKGEKVPFLKLMEQLIKRGVEIRLIHAKEPGPRNHFHAQSNFPTEVCPHKAHLGFYFAASINAINLSL